MASEELSPVDAPPWVIRRLNRLATHDPLRFVRERIPALGHRTIPEVLSAPDGAREVDRFLDRLEGRVGVKQREGDFDLPEGFDPSSTASFPDMDRVNVRWVQHKDGWSVGLLPPRVAYRSGERSARVDADYSRAPEVTYVPSTLAWIAPRRAPVESGERSLILERIDHGLRALGAIPSTTDS